MRGLRLQRSGERNRSVQRQRQQQQRVRMHTARAHSVARVDRPRLAPGTVTPMHRFLPLD